MPLTLDGARLIDRNGEQAPGRLVIDRGKIVASGPGIDGSGQAIDARGYMILPGFIDVHTHGGGGFNLHTDSPDEIHRFSAWAPSTGVTSYLIAVVGTPGRIPDVELQTAVAAISVPGSAAQPLGIHLEGPYINVKRRGAHDPSWLRMPCAAETERILAIAGDCLRLVTLAPELPGAAEMIGTLVSAGVTVSIGHTEATYEQTRVAIALGITHATHCFNAMPPLLHRAPGPIGAIVESSEVYGELIGDGIHVEPAAMRVLIRALGPERTVIITDAQAAAGMPDAEFSFAGQSAHVVDGVARLADGTIAGSVVTMDHALRNLISKVGVSLPEASAMLSYNPAQAVRVAHSKGLLSFGYDADLVVFDDELRLVATYCGGQLAYAQPDWRRRVGTSGPDSDS